jgi:hypothetical protein
VYRFDKNYSVQTNCKMVVIIGVEEHALKSFPLFPTPAKESIRIETSNDEMVEELI